MGKLDFFDDYPTSLTKLHGPPAKLQKGQLYQDAIAVIEREAETSTAAYFFRNKETYE